MCVAARLQALAILMHVERNVRCAAFALGSGLLPREQGRSGRIDSMSSGEPAACATAPPRPNPMTPQGSRLGSSPQYSPIRRRNRCGRVEASQTSQVPTAKPFIRAQSASARTSSPGEVRCVERRNDATSFGGSRPGRPFIAVLQARCLEVSARTEDRPPSLEPLSLPPARQPEDTCPPCARHYGAKWRPTARRIAFRPRPGTDGGGAVLVG